MRTFLRNPQKNPRNIHSILGLSESECAPLPLPLKHSEILWVSKKNDRSVAQQVINLLCACIQLVSWLWGARTWSWLQRCQSTLCWTAAVVTPSGQFSETRVRTNWINQAAAKGGVTEGGVIAIANERAQMQTNADFRRPEKGPEKKRWTRANASKREQTQNQRMTSPFVYRLLRQPKSRPMPTKWLWWILGVWTSEILANFVCFSSLKGESNKESTTCSQHPG